jgi:hypothetical protein
MLFGLFRSTPDRMFGRPRSRHWPEVRFAHLHDNPACVICGETKFVDVHHILPVHSSPELELDFENLVTLCNENAKNHHFEIGHGGNWRLCNEMIIEDAAYLEEMYARIRANHSS